MSSPITRRHMLGGAAAIVALPTFQSSARSESPVIHDVEIRSFEFSPEIVTAKVGDTVRWTNFDIAPHTATAEIADWDTGEITRGNSRTLLVTNGISLNYFCAFHPHMQGEVKVV